MRWANWSATMIGRSDHRQRSGGMLERLDSTLALDNPILANDSDPTETAKLHRPSRGLLSVHSRCGPHTRAVTYM